MTDAAMTSQALVAITGASSGIGRAVARHLAKEGSALCLVDLPGTGLQEAAEECRTYGIAAVAVEADVRHSRQVAAAFDAAEQLGPLTGVFNNAGVSATGSLVETDDATWEHQLSVNLTGSFYVAREAARRMLPARRGSIVNTASELALIGQPLHAAYTASKGGVLAMTRAMAAELAPMGIRVNTVCPGATHTPMLWGGASDSSLTADRRVSLEASIALGRIGKASEVAAVVSFLLSEAASYCTGSHFIVDGGRTTCVVTGS